MVPVLRVAAFELAEACLRSFRIVRGPHVAHIGTREAEHACRAGMRSSSEILERVAAVLLGLVVVTALSRAAPRRETICPEVERMTVGSSAPVSRANTSGIVTSPAKTGSETDAILRDMLLHD